MRKRNGRGLNHGGRGGLKDDREAFPFLGGNGQRDRFAYVGGELDGGIFEVVASTGTEATVPIIALANKPDVYASLILFIASPHKFVPDYAAPGERPA